MKSFFLACALMVIFWYLGLNAVLGGKVEFIRIIGLVGIIGGAVLTLISCVNYTWNARALIKQSLTDNQ